MPRRRRARRKGWRPWPSSWAAIRPPLLYRVLVEQKKLATDAGASYDGYARDAGEFSVYAVPRPGVSLETLEKAVDQVMQGFATWPSRRRRDLTRAKTQLVACVTYRRDSQFAHGHRPMARR